MQWRRFPKFSVFRFFLLLWLGLSAHAGLARGTVPDSYEFHRQSGSLKFNPNSLQELNGLLAAVNSELKVAREDESLGETSKRRIRGLKEIRRLIEQALPELKAGRSNSVAGALLETVMAVNNNQRSPVPKRVDSIVAPVELVKKLRAPVGHGESPASNLQKTTEQDLSRVEPQASTFWQRPISIGEEDLYRGFGRSNRFELGEQVCSYKEPKETYGMNPGVVVECQGASVKLKFAEISCEPFATRIFSALGYHADPTDYSPGVRVRYAREFFLEFNSRRELNTKFTVLGVVPVYTLKLQKHYDPFDYIAWAVLRNGERWTGRQLKARLLYRPGQFEPETEPANFRPEVESQLDFLVTTPANVQVRDPRVKSLGPWDFGQLDHPDRRELRGAGLLGGWLGWFDTRYDNTRLRTVKVEGGFELVHYFSDLGGVLGETSGYLFAKGELPNAFPWTFTRPPLWQGPHRMARPLVIEGYKPLAPVASFANMTVDDARWMARLIGQLSEQQIIAALIASGYESAEVRLYTEKLMSRRDRMLIDLGLEKEFPLYRAAGVNRHFSYDPVKEGPVSVTVPGKGCVSAPIGDERIEAGRLVMREQELYVAP